MRGWIKRTQFIERKRLVINLQRYARGYLARLKYMHLKYNAKVCSILKKKGYFRQNYIFLTGTCNSTIRKRLACKETLQTYKKTNCHLSICNQKILSKKTIQETTHRSTFNRTRQKTQ